SPDVLVLTPAALPDRAAAGALAPLPPGFRDREAFEWMDLLPQYREHLLAWDRAAYAVPLAGEGPVCYHRTDRLAHPPRRAAAPRARAGYGKDSGPPPGPPPRWGGSPHIAEFFTRR